MNDTDQSLIELRQALKLALALKQKISETRIEDYDPYPYQIKWHNVKDSLGNDAKQKFLQAANQVGKCNSIRSTIETPSGDRRIADIWGSKCQVIDGFGVPQNVTAWVKKPKEECFRFVLSDGRWFESPRGHLILTNQGWSNVNEILGCLPQSVFYQPRSMKEFSLKAHALNAARYFRRPLSFLADYFASYHLCDAQLLSDGDSAEVYAPSPIYARKHNSLLLRMGGLVSKCTNTLSQAFDLLSSSYADHRISAHCALHLNTSFAFAGQSSSERSQNVPLSSITGYLEQPLSEPHHHRSSLLTPKLVDGNKIVSVYSVGSKDLYDLEVENTHCYRGSGLIHHNTWAAASEVSWHATGDYPVFYAGIRLDHPKMIQVSGVTNDTTRDICQAELCGDPEDPEAFGTGTIPKSKLIGKPARKSGIPNAFDSVKVMHRKGHTVTIKFRAYEMGNKKFMGHRNDVVWADEEPPQDIWSQMNRSQIARPDSVILATFTPENGATELVNQINEDLQPGQGFVQAGWEDAPHIANTPGRIEELLSRFSPHERDMRSKGIPMMGSGLIFPVPDDRIIIDPIPIQPHWQRINGMDFGWDHPTGVAFLAYDQTTDTVYLIDEYSESKVLLPVIASAIKHRGEWIPMMWPHDGMSVGDKGTGKAISTLYKEENINMHDSWATHPPQPDKTGQIKEGSGGNSVEAGLLDMHNRMETGRFKVFSNCVKFFQEKQQYHRKVKNGQSQVVKLNDDVISAVRYAIMMLRHARTEVIFIPQRKRRTGLRMPNA